MPQGSTIGVDESRIPASVFRDKKMSLEKIGYNLVAAGSNIFDEVWEESQPPRPQEKVWVLDDKYTGQSS